MNRAVPPGPRTGAVRIPASKSQAHRLLIAAALGRDTTTIFCDGLSDDIRATADCLRALGAEIREVPGGLAVTPIRRIPEGLCRLPCRESGSTLRFLLPVAGALGAEAVFLREGRLPERPLAPLDRELTSHGMRLVSDGAELFCSGKLTPGDYTLPGDVSSQYISGLLLALPLLPGDSRLTVAGRRESAAYIAMTQDALRRAGIVVEEEMAGYRIPGGQRYGLPETLTVESDWSGAAFFLCMGALSPEGVMVSGPDPASVQGDRGILDILKSFGAEVELRPEGVFVRRGTLRGAEVDAAPVPDLIPTVCAVAAAAEGETRIVNAARLRLKESDRLSATAAMLSALGADIEELPEGLIVRGKPFLRGGTADSRGDHRIAMAAAVAASVCREPVTVLRSECAAKSYPRFWDDLDHLKGAAL